MSDATYHTVTMPRRARFSAHAPQPAAFYAHLLSQALNHGMPARRRGGRLLAVAGRTGLPTTAVASALRRARRSPAPDLDRLLAETSRLWPELTDRSARLPEKLPALSVLELQRSSGTTVFGFGEARLPLVVLRRARAGHMSVEQERSALLRAESAAVAPRVLPDVDGALTTEGLPGQPVRVQPVTSSASVLPWTAAHANLGEALVRLAEVTARPGSEPVELSAALERAATYGWSAQQRRRLVAVARDLSRLPVQMLQHKDLSAQNWLVDGHDFVGLVDWEMAVHDGVPGFDMLHCATALLEHGVGLSRWSESELLRHFEAAWTGNGLFHGARIAARDMAAAAGVGDSLLAAVEVGYFARRLGRAMGGSNANDLSLPTLAAMLRVVSES